MANRWQAWIGGFLAICAIGRVAAAAEIVVELPNDVQLHSATATAPDLKLETAGQVSGAKVTFANLLPGESYDVGLQLADGTILQGFDLNWYADADDDPAAADAVEPANEDDREQIDAIVTQIPQFYNRSRVLHLKADHQRAVALVELIRDSDFYAGKGQVVWRVELWYFQNQFGGWEKVQQQNKVLRRERYKTDDAFRKATEPIRWLPQLGGIRAREDQRATVVTLTQQLIESAVASPTTRSAGP